MLILTIVNILLIVRNVLVNAEYFNLSLVRKEIEIGACNNCSKLKTCNLDKYFYKAEDAQKKYEYTLKNSRQSVNLNTSELIELAHIICPLVKKGQFIYTILNNHPEIKLCEKTIYNYIEMGLFKDWDVTNLTLKRKVKRKVSKKQKLKKRKESVDYQGKERILIILNTKYNIVPTTEMDTVHNLFSYLFAYKIFYHFSCYH